MAIWSRDDIARIIIRVGREKGVSRRGIVIGLATGLVESNLTVYANAKVAGSLDLPHDAVGSDGMSVGVQQQQVWMGNGWWWGPVEVCQDPTSSTGLFFDRLLKLDYNNLRETMGWFAQEVQGSAYPERYDERMREAQTLYDRLTGPEGNTMPIDYGITKTMHGYNPNSIGIGNSDGPRLSTPFGAVHTQQAQSTAVNLANFCNNSATTNNPVAYNIVVDDTDTIEVVPVNEASWSAAEANGIAFHLCFAGSFAEWSEGKWLSTDTSDGLDEDKMLWRGARAMAGACQQFGIPALIVGDGDKAGPNSWPVGRGICGHRDFGRRGGGHTDPGNGFPDVEFVRRVNTFLNPTPPVVGGTTVKSLVDGKEYTAEQMTQFTNLHAWRSDQLLTALAQKQGIDTSMEGLKKIK